MSVDRVEMKTSCGSIERTNAHAVGAEATTALERRILVVLAVCAIHAETTVAWCEYEHLRLSRMRAE